MVSRLREGHCLPFRLLLWTAVCLALLCHLRPASGAITVNLLESNVTQNSVLVRVSSVLGGSDHLINHTSSGQLWPSSCPENLFGLSSGNLVALGPLPVQILQGSPRCITSLDRIAVHSFQCIVEYKVNNVLVSEQILMHVLPTVTAVNFPDQEWTGTVEEESVGAIVGGLAGLAASAAPEGGTYSTFSYSLTPPSDEFEVVVTTRGCVSLPVLRTTQPLDADSLDSYQLTLEAVHPVFTSVLVSANITIQVVDVNDNPPVFPAQQTEFSVYSNASVGSVVARLTASDADVATLNSQLQFYVVVPQSYFTIDTFSGDVLVAGSLHQLRGESYNLSVVVRDRGQPENTAELPISIRVLLATTRAPRVNLTSSAVHVREHAANGTLVTEFEVTSQTSLAPTVRLAGYASGLFAASLLSHSGQISAYRVTVAGDLDREVYKEGIRVIVEVTDGQNQLFSSTQDLLVSLVDIDDHSPVFDQSVYHMTVDEGTPGSVDILSPVVSDEDLGVNAESRFSLSDSAHFRINPTTGAVVTKQFVAQGSSDSFTLTLTALGQGSNKHNTSVLVHVDIEGYNFNPPVFTRPAPFTSAQLRTYRPEASVSVSETLGADEVIYVFTTADPDSGCSGRVTYEISHATPPVVRIDRFTGELFPIADGALDYDQFDYVYVTVRASDNGIPFRLFAESHLMINITGANDMAPIMDPIQCPCFLQEGTVAMQSCGVELSAWDPDRNEASLITYDILSGNEMNHFSFNSQTGVVSTHSLAKLDREQFPSYTLVLVATDGTHTSNNVTLNIVVQDIDDAVFAFSESSFSLRVPSGSPAGTKAGSFAVVSNDAGFNGLVLYYTSGEFPNVFHLDANTGDLVVVAAVSAPSQYNFNIHARDRQVSRLIQAQVIVMITTDVPLALVTPEIIRLVPANAGQGAVIAPVTEIFKEQFSESEIVFTLANLPSVFDFSFSAGLTVRSSLPSNPRSYTFTISASRQGSLLEPTSVPFVIYLYGPSLQTGSVTLNLPSPPSVCSYTASINEGRNVRGSTYELPASSSNGQALTHRLESSEHSSAFDIQGNSLVVNSGYGSLFDWQRAEVIRLNLTVFQGADAFYRCTVDVAIDDVNNHAPQFPQSSYGVNLYRDSPTGSIVIVLKAVDQDRGDNARTLYSLRSAMDPFSLDENSGILKLSQTLTSQSLDMYSVVVVATDRREGSFTSTATVVVNVLALTNTPPSLPSISIPSVLETASVGQSIASLPSSDSIDSDAGSQGRLKFCFLRGNTGGHFSISDAGDVTISKSLDFEGQVQPFSLTLLAYDVSPNPLFATTSFSISVLNVNENPFFRSVSYSAVVSENAVPLTHVVSVRASDPDLGDRPTYSISAGNTGLHFTIGAATGDLYVSASASLDRETVPRYSLTVTATDGSFATAAVTVSIEVKDTNDNFPDFPDQFDLVTISEDTRRGEVVFTVTASDEDEGIYADLGYRIVQGNDNGDFSLDWQSGRLKLLKELDYDLEPVSSVLMIEAVDRTNVSQTSRPLMLMATVSDVNDNPPLFSQQTFTASVSESASLGTDVIPAQATDADRGSDTLTYALQGQGMNHFRILSSGTVQTAAVLDREQVPVYNLRVTAADSGSPRWTATAVLTITVSDVNDNSPMFEALDTVQIFEDHPINVPFYILQPSDGDAEENSENGFTVDSGDADYIGVDAHSGFLYLRRKLNFDLASSLSVVVAATNTQPPSGSATVRVVVQVLDVNENSRPPFFSGNLTLAPSLPAYSGIGTEVVNITANDPDPGREGELLYSLVGGTGMPYFDIGRDSGTVTVSGSLAVRVPPSLTLHILAHDGTVAPFLANIQILVSLPLSASPLHFTSAHYRYSVVEGARSGTHVGLVSLMSEIDPQTQFSIEDGNTGGLFAVDSGTGILSVATSVQTGTGNLYQLQVSAFNLHFTAHCLVSISVLDTNDNRPSFVPTSTYSVSVFSNFYQVRPAVPILRVLARDLDEPVTNGRVTFSEDPPAVLFDVRTGGDVVVASSLSGVASGPHVVTVVATDAGPGRLDTTGTVQVTVVDSSGSASPPAFSSPAESLSVSESAQVGTRVPYASAATDADSAVLMYRLLDSSSPSLTSLQHFAVDTNSGWLHVAGRLDRESVPTYTLSVEAWDGTSSSTLQLTVNVADVNDNAPQFSMPSFACAASEGMAATVPCVSVSDSDSGSNGDILLSIVDSTSAEGVFGVSSGGDISIGQPLDRELGSEHTLTVAATDRGTPSLTAYCRVTVTVSDINDNAPTFSQSGYQVGVNESSPAGSEVLTVYAFDPDQQQQQQDNGRVSYSLNPPSSLFAVDSSTGVLTLRQGLSFAAQQRHQLTVVATDGGLTAQSATASIAVQVLSDFSSSAPLLSQPLAVTLSENLPANTLVSSVLGDNSFPVYYSLSANDRYFWIDSRTGVIRTGLGLDREVNSTYTLTASARHFLNFGTSSSVVFEVTVSDVNDNAPSPVPKSDEVTLSISELSSPSSSTLFTLQFTDRDASGSVGAVAILSPQVSRYLQIDSSGRGTLMLGRLDVEHLFAYQDFLIAITDTESPSQMETYHVRLVVEDVNDKAPVFSSESYQALLWTPAQPGAIVTHVSATDEDEGASGRVRFSISGGNGTDSFEIDAASGEIALSNPYSLHSRYHLQVSATDRGVPSLSSTANVYVEVRNCPILNFRFSPSEVSIVLSEAVPTGTVVVSPTLVHTGYSENDVQFTLISNDGGVFSIDGASGNVSLLSNLDRETVSEHGLAVQATHRSLSHLVADLSVQVVVEDVNDNPPRFTNTPYRAYISNNASAGSPVLRVNSNDPDLFEGGTISYHIASGDLGYFALNSVTGELTVLTSLTALQTGRSINLTVEARDQGVPVSLSSSAVVSVFVVDSRAPRFTQSQYTAEVSELADVGMLVTVVSATVFSSNGFPTYTIEAGNGEIRFSIDFYSGDVRVARALDFEERQEYTLDLKVSDPTLDETSFSLTTLVISVKDENDRAPVFSQNIYTKVLPESSDRDTLVTTLEATDADSSSSPNSAVTYSFGESYTFGGTFALNFDSGELTVDGETDYEAIQRYEIPVIAVDSGVPQQTGSATVFLSLTNINDNAPRFASSLLELSVQETAHNGSIVGSVSATDPDSDPITYSLEGTDSLFTIDAQTGEVRLQLTGSQGLSEPSYNLSVSARDGVHVGRTTVRVNVLDINDNPPAFTASTYYGNVTENDASAVNVVQVSATDADRGGVALTYTFERDTVSNFEIDANTGWISKKSGAIDREMVSEFVFNVFVQDGVYTSNAVVRVTVLDRNDNAPEFLSISSVDVSENLPRSSLITVLEAADADQGSNARLSFSISGVTTPSGDSVESLPFHFEGGGSNRLVLRGIVNHENKPSFTFTVVVSDAGSPSQSLSVSYTVRIVDTLDSPPHFTQSSYAFSMVEPMNYDQSVGQVMATVSDSNPYIYFSIPSTPAVPFTIGLTSGMIVATYADREVQSEYQFNVEAYVLTANQDLLKNLTSVTVTVEDINDNAPKILSFLFLGQVAENQPSGSRVLSSGIGLDVIGVEDVDNGINGTFSFQIVPLTSDAVPFIIQDDGQVLTTQTLDREGATALYMFRFVAVDKGPVAKTSEVALASIAVTDLNDSPPVFNSSAFSATVSEDASLNEEVTSVRASDADKGENANVRYSLHGSANFAIDTFTGAVRVSGALDHERQIVYNLTIDGYDGANRASVALQITVQDVNDEPPQFNVASYETTVLENSDIELPVLTVYASDVDLVGSVSYSLLSGPSRDNFTVNATGGELYFTTSPNYESAQQLVVQVVAGDGVHETLASVAVSILDQNDVTPTFPDADFEGMIFENIRAGTNVVKVSASDPDSGAGGLVQYEIIGGNAGDVLGVSVSQLPFQIAMQSGLILTTEILDREQVNHYTLHVRATDLGTPPLSSTGIVRVSVLDDNDHSPVFDRSNYSTPLSESVDDDFFVLRVRASDADSGSNAEIFYELQSGNDLGNFALDSQTGRLTVQSELDFESTRLFNLTVVAHDGGLVSLKASVSVLIEILDENDNRPTFQTKNYLHSVDENTASGSTVVTVRATDIDANAARVLYEIAEEDLIPQFEINAETGIIAIGTELDYESDREHEFRIWAYNEGDELLRDTATVTVTVGDINDEEPVFNPPNPEFSITENVPPPQSLGGVSATDPDTVTTPGDLRYSLVPSPHSSRFRLDSRTGLLTTLASFDRESVPRYRLVVTASDGGSPSQTGTTTVTVTILDVNDNVPQPANAAIFIYLAGGHFSSAAVGQVNANDPDLFNAHTYSLLSDPSSNMGPFSLHLSNGSIQAPDNPMPGSYNFVVNVTENGNWAKCTVAIQVSEINPNMAANSVTLRVTQTTAENFLANKFTGFSKMDIFGSQVPTSTRPFVVSVQDVLGADDTVDVSFAVEQEGGSFVGQELLRHLVHSNRISFSNLGIGVQTEQLDLCANEPCGLNGICQNVPGPVQRQLVSRSPPRTIVASAPTWGYRCTCLRGVSGRDCTQGSVDLCAYASCLPPTVCGAAPGERRAVCQCPVGSRLQRGICVANETACAALSCLNGASCAVQREGLACWCLDGFRGPKCQIAEPHPARCATANCLHNSSCTASSEGATCACLPGYSGITCANRADPNKPRDCSLNPCLYGGTCSPASGGAGYACACAGGFTGQDCEADLYGAVTQAPTSACDGVQCESSEYCRTDGGDSAGVCVNPCLPNPCANGGSCVKRDSGWTCSCLPGHFGPLCEVPQGRFETRGSAVHPSIDTPLNGSVYLEFAASSTYGLLFLNGRYDDHYSDFIVLELLGGFLKYTVSRGGQRYDVEFTSRDLADQQWHSVEAGYNLTHMWLTVDDCGGSGSVAFGPLGRVRGPLERPICEQTVATVDDYTSHVSLDVSGPLVLGYHRASYNYTFGESFSFSYRGYLRNVRVGGRVVDFARPLSTGGDVHSSLGLEGRPDCAASPCRNGAECLQDGFRYSCLCGSSFSGDNCERASSSVGFPGNTVVTFTLLSNSGPTGTTTKRQTSFYSSTSTVLSLGFSTTSPNGVLFALVGPTDYAYLEMVDGFLQFRFNLGLQEATASIDGVRMDTGDFHDVEARREGRTAQLVVDRMFVATASVPGDDRSLDVPAEGIYLGAGSGVGVGGVVQNPFNGCIRGAKLDGKELPLSDDSFDVNFQVSLPPSSSSSDSSLSFSCWVPPRGPIGAVPISPSLPLFVIIIIAVCATFALALLLCIVAALIARCRHGSLVKTSSGGFELQQRDFAGFRQMSLRPTNSAIPGRPNSGAGNVRNYAQEGGGESDIHRDNGELESIISSPNLTVNSHPTTNHTLSVEPNSVTATTSMTERLRITVQPLSHPVENSTLSSITQPSISPDPQFISQPSRSPSDLSNSVATTTPTSMLAMLTAVPENGERWRSREDNPRTAAVPDRSQLIPTDCRNGGPERSQAAATSHSRRTLGERVQSPIPVHPSELQLAAGERKRLEAEEAESQSRPDPAVLARTAAKPQPASKPKPKPKKASRNPEVDRIWQLKKAADKKLMRDNNFDDTHLYKEEGSLTPLSSKSLESLYHINNTSEEYSANVDFTNPQLAHLRALLQHLDIAGDDDDDESSIVTTVESSILPSQSKTPPSSILRPPPLPDKFHSSSSVTVREV